jgi:tRNA G18 (ribose-2'-O)-methylase SpoU
VPVDPIAIEDPEDPRVTDYIGLTDAELRRQVEVDGPGHGIFIAEGVRVVRVLLETELSVRSVLVTPARYEALADALLEPTFPVYLAGRAVIDRVVGFPLHRGAVAAANRPVPLELSRVLAGADRIAILEDVNDHENLGGLFRSAAALGIGGVLLSPRCSDPFYRRCVRVSMGQVLRVPIVTIDRWPDALVEVAAAGFEVVALTPAAEAEPITALSPRPGDKVALLLGAEGPGLTAAAQSAASRRVRIPMVPDVDSLNVAAAAAVAFHRLGGLNS